MYRVEVWRCGRSNAVDPEEPLYSIETDGCIVVKEYVDDELNQVIHV